MQDTSSLATFALIALGMVLTPGPNMIYLISRSIHRSRARRAAVADAAARIPADRHQPVGQRADRDHGRLDRGLSRHAATWIAVQRWLMATALGGLAVRMATESRR